MENESEAAQKMAFKTTIWIFAIDDVYDDGNFDLAELRAVTNQLLNNEPAGLPAEKQTVINDLCDIMHELLLELAPRRPGHKRYYEYLTGIFRQTFIATLDEATAGITNARSDINTYLETGDWSLGLRAVIVPTAFFMDMGLAESDEFSWADDLLKPSSEVLRLINDLATYQKEKKEKKQNSVAVIMNGLPPVSYEEAVARIDEMIRDRLQHLRNLTVPPSHDPFRQLLIRICETAAVSYSVALLD
jgi:hypothetical protein